MTHHLGESIFKSSIRVLFKAFFAMVGIALGLIAFIMIIGSVTRDSDEIQRTYTPEILPNAQGVRKKLAVETPVILQVNIGGLIGMDLLNVKTVRQQLIESREGTLKKDRVKAVLVSIDSGGGTAIDADGIYRLLAAYKKQYNVPVYAYVDGMCASGGFYIACAADKIFASDVSLIGSVGVLVYPPSFNVYKPLETLGIESKTFSAGKGKDALDSFRPWKEGEGKMLQQIVDTYYEIFVDIVLENRPQMNREELVQALGAEVFPAKQAQEYGYIDGIYPSIRDVISLIAGDLGFEEDKYQVIQLEKEKWYTQLFSMSSPLKSGKIKHEISGFSSPEFASKNPILYLYQ